MVFLMLYYQIDKLSILFLEGKKWHLKWKMNLKQLYR